jgi:hypothetical protein
VSKTGGCACGQVRYTLDPARMARPYACHCRDCQTRSGSAFTVQVLALPDALEISGETIEGRVTQPSGAEVIQVGCPRCLTRIYARNLARPDFITLRGGTLDDSDTLVPGVHLWTSSKQPWVTIPEGVTAYEMQPEDPMQWVVLLLPR